MNSKDNTNSANSTPSTREAFAGCTCGAGGIITGLGAKSLLFLSVLLFSFPVLAIDICHFSKSTQETIVSGLVNSLSAKNQWDEADEMFLSFEDQGCSALKPYKMSQLTQLSYSEGLDDYPISKANDLFKQFPAIEFIGIKVLTQKIPENLFHGLPNLKKVIIVGVIKKLPTRLFEQNSNLEEFIISSDEFIGFNDSQFFRYIPGLKDLTISISSSSSSDVPPLELPEDFCNAVPSLTHFYKQRRVEHAPASCDKHLGWFDVVKRRSRSAPKEEYTPVDRCIKGKTCGIRNEVE